MRMAMVDKHVRQNHGSNLESAVEQLRFGKGMQHMTAESADRTFFDGDQHFVLTREIENEIAIERLHETGIGDRRGQAESRKMIRSLQRFGQPGAERKNG